MGDGYITLGLGASASLGNYMLLGLTANTAPPPVYVLGPYFIEAGSFFVAGAVAAEGVYN